MRGLFLLLRFAKQSQRVSLLKELVCLLGGVKDDVSNNKNVRCVIFLLFFLFLFFCSLFSRCSWCLTTCCTLLPRNYGRFLGRGSQRRVSLLKNLREIFTPKQKHQRKIIHREIINISPIVSLSLHFARFCCFLLSVDKRRNTRTQIRVWYIITRARTCLHSR